MSDFSWTAFVPIKSDSVVIGDRKRNVWSELGIGENGDFVCIREVFSSFEEQKFPIIFVEKVVHNNQLYQRFYFSNKIAGIPFFRVKVATEFSILLLKDLIKILQTSGRDKKGIPLEGPFMKRCFLFRGRQIIVGRLKYARHYQWSVISKNKNGIYSTKDFTPDDMRHLVKKQGMSSLFSLFDLGNPVIEITGPLSKDHIRNLFDLPICAGN